VVDDPRFNATNSRSEPRSKAARRARRPVRPNPFIPTLIVYFSPTSKTFYVLLSVLFFLAHQEYKISKFNLMGGYALPRVRLFESELPGLYILSSVLAFIIS